MKSALFIDEDTLNRQFSERIWHPKDFCETVHEIKGRSGIWLSTNDMEILGLDEWIRYKEIDKISYSQSLMDNGVINELISAIKAKMAENPEHSSIFFEKNRLEQLVKIQNEEFPDYGI